RNKVCGGKSAEAIVQDERHYPARAEPQNVGGDACYQMKGRKQKISKDTWLQNDRAVPEDDVAGQTFMWISENNPTYNDRLGYGLLEFILSPNNLNEAYRRVKRKKGAGGVDKMEVESLKDYLISNKDELTASI